MKENRDKEWGGDGGGVRPLMADSPTNERQQQCHLASVISLLCLQALHITTLLRHV